MDLLDECFCQACQNKGMGSKTAAVLRKQTNQFIIFTEMQFCVAFFLFFIFIMLMTE